MLDPSQKGVTREYMYSWLYDFNDKKVKYTTGLSHKELAKLVRQKQPECTSKVLTWLSVLTMIV